MNGTHKLFTTQSQLVYPVEWGVLGGGGEEKAANKCDLAVNTKCSIPLALFGVHDRVLDPCLVFLLLAFFFFLKEKGKPIYVIILTF